MLSRDISARGRSHQRVPFITRYSEACSSSTFTKKRGSAWYLATIHASIRSRSLSAWIPRSYQPFCTRSLRNDVCREIHGVTISGNVKIAYCFLGQNVALFFSSILESNLFRFDTRYKLFAGFCMLNHSIYMLCS